ncbi:hypothetical protein CR513_50842, partial [Mucuna pruriens]
MLKQSLGGNDKNSTNKDKDNLRDIGSPMTRSKTKMLKQSLLGLSSGIKENLEPSESECWFYRQVAVAVKVKFPLSPSHTLITLVLPANCG